MYNMHHIDSELTHSFFDFVRSVLIYVPDIHSYFLSLGMIELPILINPGLDRFLHIHFMSLTVTLSIFSRVQILSPSSNVSFLILHCKWLPEIFLFRLSPSLIVQSLSLFQLYFCKCTTACHHRNSSRVALKHIVEFLSLDILQSFDSFSNIAAQIACSSVPVSTDEDELFSLMSQCLSHPIPPSNMCRQ